MLASQPSFSTCLHFEVVYQPALDKQFSARPGEEAGWHVKEEKPARSLHIISMGACRCKGHGSKRQSTEWTAHAKESFM